MPKSIISCSSLVFSLLVLGLYLAQPASANNYISQPPVPSISPDPVPSPVDEDYCYETDHRIQHYTCTGSGSTIHACLGVFDMLGGAGDSNSLRGVVHISGSNDATWVWCGDPSSAPGASFDILITGDGSAATSGTATAAAGYSASSSGSCSAAGSGSCHGFQKSASANDVGGSCTATGTGSASGSLTPSSSGAGITVGWSRSTTGIGSFAKTGVWNINATGHKSVGGGASTILLHTAHSCTISGSATASGYLGNGSYGHVLIDVSASAGGRVDNIKPAL
jgi:hypothetical protein